MSYILDALKKSEREKTLGQVPTLETVISDGAKKQPTGTPWWLNLLVFLFVLTAILVGMYFAGLINFDSKKDTFSTLSNSTQNNQIRTDQSAPKPESAAVVETEIEETAVKQAQQHEQIPVAQAQESETVSQQLQEQTVQTEVIAEAEIQPQAENTNVVESEAETQEVATAEQQAQELAALEQLEQAQIAEVQQPVIDVEPEELQPVEPEQTAEVQSQGNDYEEALHQNLRSIAVNVVSYSSEARQRFVMLDLTIYKEGDSMPNGADIVEIQRTGAIVEFQNKRYLLKP